MAAVTNRQDTIHTQLRLSSEASVEVTLNPDPRPASEVVESLASAEGPLDVYCWYEGRGDLPKVGAKFMTDALFAPLFERKQDARLHLCSFKNWSFEKTPSQMAPSTPLGDAINRIHEKAVKCIDSSAFFRYCQAAPKQNPHLSQFINQELSLKQQGVVSRRICDKKVGEIFEQQSSLFDSIRDRDAGSSYPLMRYVEGYYLVQDAVTRGLCLGQEKIQIAFVLPNDEDRFYKDFPQDLGKMLDLDFQEALSGIQVVVSFHFFEYGTSNLARPYNMGSHKKAVLPAEISRYFTFLQKPQFVSSIPRDDIHRLNDGMIDAGPPSKV